MKKQNSDNQKAKKERIKIETMASEVADLLYEARAWRQAGKKHFACTDIEIWEYKAGVLPGKCAECWKVCVFRFGHQDYMHEFLETLDQDLFLCKYNASVAVFYFDTKEEADQFLSGIRGTLEENDWTGEVQRACKKYRDFRPEWWLDKVTFSPSERKNDHGNVP